MDMNKIILATVASIAVAGLAASADAATIHMGGSSAARQFINEVPLAICAAGSAVDTVHYRTVDNNKHLWRCTTSGTLNVFNYSARGSADGVTPLGETLGSAGAKGAVNGRPVLPYLDDTNPQAVNACPAPTAGIVKTVTLTTGAVVNLTIAETDTGSGFCPDAGPFSATGFELNLGASDVLFSSFGQISPGASEPVPATGGSLVTDAAMVLPFNVMVANNLRRLTTGGADNGSVQSLTRKEIEGLYSGVITNWKEIGIGYTVNGDGTGGIDPAATHTVRLCMRSAGSGSKAAFDKIIMKEGSEVNIGNPNWTYNVSSSNMRGCLNSTTAGTRGRIGYIDVSESQVSPPYVAPVQPSLVTAASPVKIDGFQAVDSSVAAVSRAESLKFAHCGKGYFTTNLRFYRRPAGAYAADVEALAQLFVDTAKDTDVIRGLPAAWAFAAPDDMLFTRTDDGGVHDHTFDRAGAGSNAICNGL